MKLVSLSFLMCVVVFIGFFIIMGFGMIRFKLEEKHEGLATFLSLLFLFITCSILFGGIHFSVNYFPENLETVVIKDTKSIIPFVSEEGDTFIFEGDNSEYHLVSKGNNDFISEEENMDLYVVSSEKEKINIDLEDIVIKEGKDDYNGYYVLSKVEFEDDVYNFLLGWTLLGKRQKELILPVNSINL